MKKQVCSLVLLSFLERETSFTRLATFSNRVSNERSNTRTGDPSPLLFSPAHIQTQDQTDCQVSILMSGLLRRTPPDCPTPTLSSDEYGSRLGSRCRLGSAGGFVDKRNLIAWGALRQTSSPLLELNGTKR